MYKEEIVYIKVCSMRFRFSMYAVFFLFSKKLITFNFATVPIYFQIPDGSLGTCRILPVITESRVNIQW